MIRSCRMKMIVWRYCFLVVEDARQIKRRSLSSWGQAPALGGLDQLYAVV